MPAVSGGQSAIRGGGSRRRTLVPEARNGINNLKYEAAAALGVPIPADGYYGFVTARDAGSLGGFITKNLVAMAEEQLSGGQFAMAGMGGGAMGGGAMAGGAMAGGGMAGGAQMGGATVDGSQFGQVPAQTVVRSTDRR